mmetsp:Transcript_40050/g.106012  ORF Transcript_40050/g.106012 Transcript_40050/m.106012 type:complete len:318 (+) Transcript_40050:99-1052(+)
MALVLAALAAVEDACSDKHAACGAWAASGECAANANFMLVECQQSCDACGRTPCSPFETSVDGASSADYLATFERAASLAAYSPVVLSETPWVVRLDTFLTPAEAATVAEVGGHAFERSTEGNGGAKAVSAARTSSSSWCNVPTCEEHPMIRTVKARILDVLRMPEENCEHLQVLRYEVGQFYRVHHDQSSPSRALEGPRVYTFYLYLSDVAAGGGTRFPELNITVQPRAGRAVLWPSVLHADMHSPDWRTRHESLPVEDGVKYGANFWVHLRNFQGPFRLACTGVHASHRAVAAGTSGSGRGDARTGDPSARKDEL